MNRPIDNQHVIEIKALPSPRAIKTKLPITDQAAALVVETREAIRRILHGKDRDRLTGSGRAASASRGSR